MDKLKKENKYRILSFDCVCNLILEEIFDYIGNTFMTFILFYFIIIILDKKYISGSFLKFWADEMCKYIGKMIINFVWDKLKNKINNMISKCFNNGSNDDDVDCNEVVVK